MQEDKRCPANAGLNVKRLWEKVEMPDNKYKISQFPAKWRRPP